MQVYRNAGQADKSLDRHKHISIAAGSWTRFLLRYFLALSQKMRIPTKTQIKHASVAPDLAIVRRNTPHSQSSPTLEKEHQQQRTTEEEEALADFLARDYADIA